MDKIEVNEDQSYPTGTIKGRYNLGYAERNPFLERAREAAEITIPSLLPREGHSSANFFRQPFQSVGARGVNNLASKFDCLHLSAGDLLRQEVASGSHMAELINGYIREGQIVPSHITIQLIKKAIFSASHKKVLVDGFPRAMDQAHEFTQVTGVECEFCLFFDCPEDILVDRLLERGKTSGRADDNMHSIEKRFVTFKETSMPVVEHFDRKGILKRIDSSHPHPDLVFEEVKKIFHAHL